MLHSFTGYQKFAKDVILQPISSPCFRQLKIYEPVSSLHTSTEEERLAGLDPMYEPVENAIHLFYL